MEELLYMVLRGLAIGVVVSAPMGPVGILCIQRTLDKGRRSGFFTGIGAAISDLLYCLLTGFCLSFIEDFIQRNRMPIQLVGSAVLIFFGIYLLRKNPVDSLRQRADMDSPSPGGDILRGFLFTFSNPLILFLIIGLFAQFNFVIEGMKFYHYILGFIGIIAGAIGWWWVVTYFVDKLRAHFNVRSMWLINRIIGVIILIFAAIGIYSSVSAVPAPAPPYSFRVSDHGRTGWSLDVVDSIAEGFSVKVTRRPYTDAFGDRDADRLAVTVVELRSGRELSSAVASKGFDCGSGWNSWRLERDGLQWTLYGGNRSFDKVLSFSSKVGADCSASLSATDTTNVRFAHFRELSDVASAATTVTDVDSLVAVCSRLPVAGVDGIYSLFDYSHDETYATLGGRYRIAVISDVDSDSRSIFYLGGALKLARDWQAGMKKGSLKATPFRNIFDAEWIDARGDAMRYDVRGEFDPLTATLTIQFPYQNSNLRFRKE